ncbi:NADH dehydrogenase [ubiquinone] 1 beta subcomplex subunit 3 [Megalopta genalis]|uniref:NADH dehydrogenase [ubiquinone] 1 beta subcomplex subunit 3 n=1 Tax=Megalopta genalis TaxID=115081 RepID=UPI003FD5C964
MGHGDEIPKVPSPDVYKVEDVPELMMVREELAKKGLKDPWLRNEVWRYHDLRMPLKKQSRIIWSRGLMLGIPAFLITIAVEKYYGIEYKEKHDH